MGYNEWTDIAAGAMERQMEKAIKAVIEHEIEEGQEVYEMLMDGYNGDKWAYMEDYLGDYEATFTDEGIQVKHIAGGRPWMVKADGTVTREW